jgi:hypothetical protein
MEYKIGDLVADYDIKISNRKELLETAMSNMDMVYTFGLIIDAEPIDPEDKYYQLYKDSFIDNTSYTIMWADYEHPIQKYSAGHIKQFRQNLFDLEKEIDEKDRAKQTNTQATEKGSGSKD